MGYQYPSPPRGPGALLVQGEDRTIRSTASLDAPDLWDQYLSEWWQYYLADIYSQVRLERTGAYAAADCDLPNPTQETASIITDARNPRTKWPQIADRLTARSPILSQGQNPETPPSTFSHSNCDGSMGNQAGAMSECYTHAEYGQVGKLTV
jgi:hypothetical protein